MHEVLRSSEKESARSGEAFWRYGGVTPTGRRSEDFRGELEELRVRVAALESKPLDAANVMFSGKAFIAACAMVGAIIGGDYWLNGGARSEIAAGRADVREIKTILDERTKAQDKINAETKAAIEAVRSEIKSTEERIKAEIRMKDYAKANGLRQP